MPVALLRRLGAAVTAVACAVGLSACVGLPTSGPVQTFDADLPAQEPAAFSGFPPEAGTTPQRLISDFLQACSAGVSDDFVTARLYLTEAAQKSWNPVGEVGVYATSDVPDVTATVEDGADAGTGRVEVPVMVTVGADGVFTRLERPTQVRRDFELVKVNGEWRIGGLADGYLVSDAAYRTGNQEVFLLFPSADGQVLIEDPRWYPRTRVSTHVVNGLIGGPSEAIAGDVVNPVPDDATLPSSGLSLLSGELDIELEGTAPADEHQRDLLDWQFTTTLSQATSVKTVRLTISGVEISAQSLPQAPAYRLGEQVGIADGGIVRVGSSGDEVLVADAGEGAAAPALAPTGPATVAWTVPGSVRIKSPVGGPVDSPAVDPTRPSIDRLGWTWFAPDASRTTVRAVSTTGDVIEVLSGLPTGGRIVDIRISPDGARALILHDEGDSSTVYLSVVERESSGRPRGLGPAQPIAPLGHSVTSVSWAANTTVMAARDAGAGAELVTYPLANLVQTLALPEGAVRISVGATPADVLVTGRDGTLWQRSGSAWLDAADGLTDPAYAG